MTAPNGLILAGGLATRMGGGDKPLRPLGAGCLLDHVIARTRPQVHALALGANGDPARFARFGLPVIADEVGGQGPLGGMLAGLRWARAAGAARLLVVPGDTPFLPHDLVARLSEAQGASIVLAASAGRAHPTLAVLATVLADDLAKALADGIRAVRAWMARHAPAIVAWPITDGDPFANINTPADLADAERRLG